MTKQLPLSLKAAVLVAIVMSAVACSKTSDDATAGEKLDSAVSNTEQHAKEAAADIKQGISDFNQDVKEAASSISATAEDLSITTRVTAELAKDDKLSALKVKVETKDGEVLLTGKAPDSESRERATLLASNVKGVTKVENKLEIGD